MWEWPLGSFNSTWGLRAAHSSTAFCAEEQCGVHAGSFQAIVGLLSDWPGEGPGGARTQLLAELSCVSVPLLCPPLLYPLASLRLIAGEPAASHPFVGARLRTSVRVGDHGNLHGWIR